LVYNRHSIDCLGWLPNRELLLSLMYFLTKLLITFEGRVTSRQFKGAITFLHSHPNKFMIMTNNKL